MSAFAQRLKLALEQANMSQSELAAKSGLSKASISQYLAGKNVPARSRISLLAKVLGVDDSFLTGYEVPATPTSQEVALSDVLTPISINTRDAARCMKKSAQFVREGLKRGILPFGNAVPGSGTRVNYYINPDKFRAYVGEVSFTTYFGAPHS